MNSLAEHLQQVKEKIKNVMVKTGRSADQIKLVAVTKTVTVERVQKMVDLGVHTLGENRVQEATEKIPLLAQQKIEWHFIGYLQSNKVKQAVKLFDWIQSVDSLRLAEMLEKEAEKQSRKITALIEVNIGGESTKFGVKPEETVEILKETMVFKFVSFQGLMTVAPAVNNPEAVRQYFRRMAQLKNEAEQKLGRAFPYLSMGMTGDFEVALEEGANVIRVGRALFGER